MFDVLGLCFLKPDGEKIRRQLGPGYQLIAIPKVAFTCVWHRLEEMGHTDPKVFPPVEVRWLVSGEDPPLLISEKLKAEPENPLCRSPKRQCEVRVSPWPEGIETETLTKFELPIAILPDGQRVFFIPDVESYGPILPHRWKKLRENACASHKVIIKHCYDVTLSVLQFWKKLGPTCVERRKERESLIQKRIALVDFNEKLDPSGRDQNVEEWIRYWAPDLWDNPKSKLPSYKKARAILASATGLGEQNIGTIVGRASSAGE